MIPMPKIQPELVFCKSLRCTTFIATAIKLCDIAVKASVDGGNRELHDSDDTDLTNNINKSVIETILGPSMRNFYHENEKSSILIIYCVFNYNNN